MVLHERRNGQESDDSSSCGDHECLCRNSCQSVQQSVLDRLTLSYLTAMTWLKAPNMCWSDKCKCEVAGISFLNQVSLKMEWQKTFFFLML